MSQVAMLEKKSKENYKCALLADDGKCFNAAVSRFYYSCFLLAKRCAYELNWLTDQDFSDYRSNTHQLIESGYIDRMILEKSIGNANIAKLKHFVMLKKHRKEAEYSHDTDFCAPCKKQDYEYCKTSAKKFIEAIEEIHKIKIIEGD